MSTVNRSKFFLWKRRWQPLRCIFAAGVLAVPGSVRATWYSENIADGADIIMMDLRWPWWPSGSYFANWNSGFNPKPNNISFYAGFAGGVPDGPGQTPNPDASKQDAFRPFSVWTFWGGDAGGAPVRFVDVAPHLYIMNNYGGEGSSGTAGSVDWPFVARGQWFTMVARVWRPVEGGNEAFMGRWIKDPVAREWHLMGFARLPIPAQSFTGNSGFLEPLGSEKAVRALHRRLGYFRKDGAWQKSDTITISNTQYVIVNTVPEGDHEYAAIEYAQHPANLPRDLKGPPLPREGKFPFTTKQPDKPSFDQPAVTAVEAVASGDQIAVSWKIPASATPMLACRVELFADTGCTGQPLAVKEVRLPNLRDLLLPAPADAGAVRLTVTDIFDQSAPPVVVEPRLVKVIAPPAVTGPLVPGLAYELLHRDGWKTLAELPRGKTVQRGLARGFDTSVRGDRNNGFGLTFSGLLRANHSGPYIFRAKIDGAYRFLLDGAEVLSWDGPHGTSEKAAVVVLAPGEHPLRVEHVHGSLPAANFGIDWEGPGFARQPIALESLHVVDEGALPSATLEASAPGDGTGVVIVKTEARGHRIERVALHLGALQLTESQGASLEYRGPLPAGRNTLWARVWHDGDHTVDTAPVVLDVTGQPARDGWTLRNVGDAKASAGVWQAGPGSFRFFGNGMHTVTRRTDGDFTATCRIADYAGAHGEPVNARAWTGLTSRERGEARDWNWGRDFHLVQTAREGMFTSADFTDLGAGRIASYAVKPGPWLRIIRRGDVWTAWSSPDGQQWELGGYQFKRTQAAMETGLFFSALPQEARAHYHASVTDFSVTSGAAEEMTLPEIPAAADTGGPRLTGVAMAPGDTRVIVVRSTHAGLLRSSDGGQSWTPANGGLSGADLAVRSVAIHPANPDIMLRAGDGGAWRTEDAGKSWKRLPLDADFDGTGPSALCGEVLAFDLRDPHTLYAGAESRGFFKSTDDGASWQCLGATGERITSVVVWAWEKFYPAAAGGKAQLCITTCPDRWMQPLGRGTPRVATAAKTARSYRSHDGVKTISLADERSDTGFYNVIFDKASMTTSEMRYATTHGVQAQVSEGAHSALYPPQKSLDWFRPCTGIAAAAQGEAKFGRCLSGSLVPSQPARISQSERWAFEWSWLKHTGDLPAGGLIAVAADIRDGKTWSLLHTDGLFLSTDGGRTLHRVLDAEGHPAGK